jgi:hypothetical protein
LCGPQLGKDLVHLVEVQVLLRPDLFVGLVEELFDLLKLGFFLDAFLLEKVIDQIQVCFINTP